MITEDDDLAAAIDRFVRRHPGVTRAGAVKELAKAGARVGTADDESSRRSRIAEIAGAFSDAYEPGYLDSLRDEWPE